LSSAGENSVQDLNGVRRVPRVHAVDRAGTIPMPAHPSTRSLRSMPPRPRYRARMITTILAASLATPPTEAEQTALWASDRDQRMAWCREARFGMFIHWGLPSPACGFCDGSVHPTVPTLDGGPATQSDGAAP
jgi:hypothetical protein